MSPPNPSPTSSPARLSERPPDGDALAAHAGRLLRTLRRPPRLDDAASARLLRGVEAAARAAPRRPRWPLMLSAAVAAGVVALVAFPRRPPDSSFHPRGRGQAALAPAVTGAQLLMYRLGAGGRPEPLGDRIRRDDELAFAYRNDGQARRLMVFARDEHGHLYWYHPAWTDPAQNPEAIPLAADPGPHELPAAISQPLDGRRLEICWLFASSGQALHVREVEGALARGELTPGCRQVEVAP
jgi:hypothetical protein